MFNHQEDANPWRMIGESIGRLIPPSDSLIIAAYEVDRENLQHEISVSETAIYTTNTEILRAVTLLMAMEEIRCNTAVPSYLDLIENEQVKAKKSGEKQ